MSRWIDADELLSAFGEVRADYNCFNELERPRYEMWSNAIDFINTMARSSIDIVRCKECKHWKGDGAFTLNELGEEEQLCKWWSKFGTIRTATDDFCSYGERRE